MAENITQYKAGKALIALLQQHELKDSAIQQITAGVAELLEEARCTPSKAVKGQQVQQAQTSVRDLQAADAVLQGLTLIIPRGKFDCAFYSDCMQVTNKQTSAEVPYSSIQHVLIIDAVPKQPNTTFLVLVMKSGQPVRQGKNALDLVVMQTKDQPELTIASPEVCQHLGPQLVGAAAVVLSQLFASYIEGIADDTFLTADSSVFSSSAGDLMVAANKGAQSGWLVPLSAGLCYLGKQGSFLPHSNISRVQFHRTGGSSSTFDITIKLAAAAGAGGAVAGAGSRSLELGQIDAAELPKLQTYCMNQRIKMGGDDDDSDGGAHAAPSAAGAAAAAGGGRGAAAAESDDDDEEDEDFDPEAAGRRPAKKRRLDSGAVAAAAAATAAAEDDGEGDDSDDADGDEDDYGGSDMSSDPELVATDDMSDMQDDDGLGDYE